MAELWSLFKRQESDFAMIPHRLDFFPNRSFQRPSFAVTGGRVFFLVPHREQNSKWLPPLVHVAQSQLIARRRRLAGSLLGIIRSTSGTFWSVMPYNLFMYLNSPYFRISREVLTVFCSSPLFCGSFIDRCWDKFRIRWVAFGISRNSRWITPVRIRLWFSRFALITIFFYLYSNAKNVWVSCKEILSE